MHPDGHFFLSPIEFIASNDGMYSFYTRATDNLGNTEEIPATTPDSGAEIRVDTVAPDPLTITLPDPGDFNCYGRFNPSCHTLKYDVEIELSTDPDYAEMYISGDVSTDLGSTYSSNVNQWIPFSSTVTVPLDPSVDGDMLSKQKTITVKVRDAASAYVNDGD